MEIVYCIYEVHPDADGWPDYNLLSICSSIEKAKEIISSRKNVVKKPIHPSMNETNNYTYIGYREDSNTGNYLYGFGGYIIELTEVDKIIN
jgi:hypothetical protein